MVELSLALLVLVAALFHAIWNGLAKGSSDPLLGMTVVSCAGATCMGTAALFLPFPAAPSWPFLAISTFVHVVYQLVLVRGYMLGDLSQVYPIARGMAPLGVAILAASTAGEVPSSLQALGLLLASGAIAMIGWSGRGASREAVATAATTAVLIAVYTTLDGHGVRVAGSAWSYAAWVLFLHAIPIAAITAVLRRGRITEFLRNEGLRTAAGGVMAVTGYTIVLYAMSVSSMAAVAALRESSVVFAAFIGVRMLGEPFGRRRIVATIILAVGLGLIAN
ncbi:MAG: drug/metabolite transporter (DMT)-like permease [Hyphomicrobiaceae bacterium]|jgi:drug/metabolite transporter (DMT)-like permease